MLIHLARVETQGGTRFLEYGNVFMYVPLCDPYGIAERQD
jgi:hypothetical protein